MGLKNVHQLLILSGAWTLVVVSAICLWKSVLKGNDLSLLIILVLLNGAVTVTVACMQLRVLQICAVRVSGSSKWIGRLRGSNYALCKNKSTKEIQDDRNCVLAGWGVGHILMYALIAGTVPARWKELFFVGLVWELAEYPFGVSCALDLIYNAIGIAIGLGARRALERALVGIPRSAHI